MRLFSKKAGLFELVVAILLASIFAHMTFDIATDIQLHAQFIIDYAYGNIPFQVNFMYYFTVYFLSFFSKDPVSLLQVSIFVLTAITFYKYLIVKRLIYTEIDGHLKNPVATASIVSVLLLLCFSLPSILYWDNDFYYLLSFPPNVWHNSTTIFAMPFVILLFWTSMKQLQEHSNSRLYLIGLLTCANAFIKPSFLFIYLLIFPLFLLRRFKFSKLLFINLTPLFLASVLIAAEYFFIYATQSTDSTVTINFFYLINTWSAHGNAIYIAEILSSTIIASFLFPIVAILKNRSMLKDDKMQFVLLGTFMAIVMANSLSETGSRATHGNFLWQCYMLSFLLFLVCTLQIIKRIAVHPRKWKAYRIEITAFMLHVISGLLYFVKIIYTHSYF